MEYKELKTKGEKELQKLIVEQREKLRELKFKTAANQLKNIRELRTVRKQISQIMFLLATKASEKNPLFLLIKRRTVRNAIFVYP